MDIETFNRLFTAIIGFVFVIFLRSAFINRDFDNYDSDKIGDNFFNSYTRFNVARDVFTRHNGHMVKKIGRVYQFFNAYVFCEYYPDEFKIKISDAKDIEHTLTASPLDRYTNKTNVIVFLDSILFNFNREQTFGILRSRILRSTMFQIIEKNPKQTQALTKNNNVEPKYYEELTERININTADEKTLAQLPGINIIKAKKLIQYRELHGGFKSVKEFLAQAQVKTHFEERIAVNIFLGRRKPDDNNNDDGNNNGERIVDLE